MHQKSTRKLNTLFFDSCESSGSKPTTKEHPLVQAIKARDSHKLIELLQHPDLSLGDVHIPILMLQTDQEDIKKILVDKMQQEISILEDEEKTPEFGPLQKMRLILLYLNTALYHHGKQKSERQWEESCYHVLRYWQGLIKNCTPKEAEKFARLGLLIGNTYLKLGEPRESIRYFENAIELEQKSEPRNRELQRSRLLYLADNLVNIYFRLGYQCQCKHQYGHALSSNISAAENNLLRLTVVQKDEHKIKIITHFNRIYKAIDHILKELNTMDEATLFTKENVHALNLITLPQLHEQNAELTKAIAELQISNQALVGNFTDLLKETEHKVEEFKLRCSRPAVTLV